MLFRSEKDEDDNPLRTQRCEVSINVTKVVPESISVEVDGTKTIYPSSSEDIVKSALTVKAKYNNSTESVEVSNYTLDAYTLVTGTVTLTINYTYNDVTVSTTADITVVDSVISSLAVDISGLTGKTIYTSQNINDLSDYIAVSGKGSDGSDMGAVAGYTLSCADGAWKAGLVVVTVTYNNGIKDLTTTFSVLLVSYSLSKTEISFNDEGLTLYGDYKFSDIKADLESRLSVVGTWTDGNNHANEHTFGTPTASGTDGGATFTVTYTVDGVSKTETIDLTLNAVSVTGVEVKANDNYKLYTSQQTTAIESATKLYVVYNSGNKTEISWGSYQHSFNANGWANGGEVTVNVSVEYDSNVYNTSVTLTVTKVEITSLEITYTPNAGATIYTTSTYNDILSGGTLTVKGVKNDGTKEELSGITAANLSGTLTAGNSTVTVTYNNGTKNLTGTFTVSVTAVTATKFEVTYNLTGATFYEVTNVAKLNDYITGVKLKYSDGSEESVSYDATGAAGYKLEGDFTKVVDGKSTVKVKYSKDGVDYEESIEVTITADPLQTVNAVWSPAANAKFYKKGGVDAIVASKALTVTANYLNAGAVTLDADDYTVTVQDDGEIPDGGEVTLVVTYSYNGTDYTDTFNVTITKKAADSVKAKYELNEKADVYTTTELSELEEKGTLTVTVVYNDGSEEEIANSETETLYTVSGDFSVAGKTNVTVTYGTYTTTFEVDVKEVEITSIEAAWNDGKESADVYQSTDAAKLAEMMTVKAKYNDGKTADIELLSSQYSLTYSFTAEGETTVTVNGLSLQVDGVTVDISTLSCTLKAEVKGNKVVSMQASYNAPVYTSTTINEIYKDVAHLTVTLVYADNSTKVANVTDFVLSGDLSNSGNQKITVTYKGSEWDPEVEDKTCEITVFVKAVEIVADSVEFEYKGNVTVFTDTDQADVEEEIKKGIVKKGTLEFNDGKDRDSDNNKGYSVEITGLTWVKDAVNEQKWNITAAVTIKSTRTYWDGALNDYVTVADTVFADYTGYTLEFQIEISYKITYNNVDAEDSNYTNSNPDTYKVGDGDITLSDATRVGYTFGGWYSDAAHVTEVTTITVSDKVDVVLYAKWELAEPEFEIDEPELEYTGDAQEFVINITNKVTGLTYTYEWYKDGETDAFNTSDRISLTSVTDSLNNVKVTVTVCDKDGVTASADIIVDVKITKAKNTVTVTIDGWTYGEDAKEPKATVTFGDKENVTYEYFSDFTCQTSLGNTAPTVAGTYYVKGYLDGTDDYEAVVNDTSNTPTMFKIEKKEISVPTINGKEYTGETLTADIESGDDYTVETNAGGIAVDSYDVVLKLTDADNTKWASAKGAVIDENAGTVTIQFAITKAANEVTVSISGWTYGGTANTPSATVKFGDAANATYEYSTSETGTYSATVPSTAGEYWVRARLAGTDDYAEGVSAAVKFVIAKAASSISITDAPGWTYSDGAKTPVVDKSHTEDADVTYKYSNNEIGEYTETVPEEAGTWYVKAVLGESKNYEGSESAPVSFVIAKANNEVLTFTISDWIQGNEASVPVLTAKFGADTAVYTYADREDGNFTGVVPTAPGKHYIKVTIPGTKNYYEATRVISFWINKESASQKNENGEDEIKVDRPTGLNPDAEVKVDPMGDEEIGGIDVPGNKVLGGFDITITDDENGLNLPMTVEKLIPEELRGIENLKVYAVKEDGTKVDCNAERDGDYLIFTSVAGCGKYVIVEEIPEVSENPAGWIASVSVFGILAAAAIAVAIVIFIKKRNEKEEENA